DLLHRPLGAEVVRPDQEYDAFDEPEGVAEHQPLHLAVVGAAPAGPGQERPADLDLAPRLVVAVEPRGPDGAAVLAVDGDQRAGGAGRIRDCPETPGAGRPDDTARSAASCRGRSSPASALSGRGWHAGTSAWSPPVRGPATARSRCCPPRGAAGSWRRYGGTHAGG